MIPLAKILTEKPWNNIFPGTFSNDWHWTISTHNLLPIKSLSTSSLMMGRWTTLNCLVSITKLLARIAVASYLQQLSAYCFSSTIITSSFPLNFIQQPHQQAYHNKHSEKQTNPWPKSSNFQLLRVPILSLTHLKITTHHCTSNFLDL